MLESIFSPVVLSHSSSADQRYRLTPPPPPSDSAQGDLEAIHGLVHIDLHDRADMRAGRLRHPLNLAAPAPCVDTGEEEALAAALAQRRQQRP